MYQYGTIRVVINCHCNSTRRRGTRSVTQRQLVMNSPCSGLQLRNGPNSLDPFNFSTRFIFSGEFFPRDDFFPHQRPQSAPSVLAPKSFESGSSRIDSFSFGKPADYETVAGFVRVESVRLRYDCRTEPRCIIHHLSGSRVNCIHRISENVAMPDSSSLHISPPLPSPPSLDFRDSLFRSARSVKVLAALERVSEQGARQAVPVIGNFDSVYYLRCRRRGIRHNATRP